MKLEPGLEQTIGTLAIVELEANFLELLSEPPFAAIYPGGDSGAARIARPPRSRRSETPGATAGAHSVAMHAADLRRLLDAAHRGGESRAFLDRMAAQLVHLELRVADLERLVDRRRLDAHETARKVQRLRSQGLPRRTIVARLGISVSAYQRAVETHRGSGEGRR